MANSLPKPEYDTFLELLDELFGTLKEGNYFSPEEERGVLRATSAQKKIVDTAKANYVLFKSIEGASTETSEWFTSVKTDFTNETKIQDNVKTEFLLEFCSNQLSNIYKAYRAKRVKGTQMRIVQSIALSLGYMGWKGFFSKRALIPNHRPLIDKRKEVSESTIDSVMYQKMDKLHAGLDEVKQIVIGNSEGNKRTIPKELTINFPWLRADQIVGRSTDIDDLRDRLFDKRQVVLMNGMGGIGKTTVAAVYATENTNVYKHIAWIKQESGDFMNDLINTRGLLETINIDKRNKDVEQLFYEVLRVLNSIDDKPCLMVIDNALCTLSNYFNLLPNQPNWHILVTSREEIPYFDNKELGFLDEAKAIDLFKFCYVRKDISDNEIKDIVQGVDYHTLTIEILAKTAYDHRIPPKFILKAIEDDIEAGISVKHSDKKIDRITSYLSSIFRLSDLSENETWVLSNLSCLVAEFHTFNFLIELIQPNVDKDFAKSLSELSKKGWLIYDTFNDAYKLHRIIIEVIINHMCIRFEVIQSLLKNVSTKMIYDQNRNNPIDRFIWIPYARSILKHLNDHSSPVLAELQHNLALLVMIQGRYEEAKDLLLKSLKSDIENFGIHHTRTMYKYLDLADLFRVLGQFDRAEEIFEYSIYQLEGVQWEDTHIASVSYTNFGLLLYCKEEYEEAKKFLLKSEEIQKKNYGIDHPSMAICYTNLAMVYGALREYEEATEMAMKSIELDEKNFGPNHPSTTSSYENLGAILIDLEEYREAKEWIVKALDINRNFFGDFHPRIATNYSDLACVHIGIKEYEVAKELFEKATEICEDFLGSSHPTTVNNYFNLAIAHKSLAEYDIAKDLLLMAKDFALKRLGERDTLTISIIRALGDLGY